MLEFESILLKPCLLQPCLHVAGTCAALKAPQMKQLGARRGAP